MSVRYLNATGTQALINEIKQRLATKTDASTTQALANQIAATVASIPTQVSQLENDVPYLTSESAADLYYSKELGEQVAEIAQQNQLAIAELQTKGLSAASVRTTDELTRALSEATSSVVVIFVSYRFRLTSNALLLNPQTLVFAKNTEYNTWSSTPAKFTTNNADMEIATIFFEEASSTTPYILKDIVASITTQQITVLWNSI